MSDAPVGVYVSGNGKQSMKANLLGFGEVEVNGERYDHDIVIDAGNVKKRKNGVSIVRTRVRTNLPISRVSAFVR